jgi:hypothetical protein
MLPGPVATAVAAAAAAARGRATKMSETQPYTRSAGYADLSQGPASVSVYSSVKVWWQCPEGPDHIFQATPKQRLHGYNCPSCANRQVSVTNSLAGVFPGEHSGRAPGLTHCLRFTYHVTPVLVKLTNWSHPAWQNVSIAPPQSWPTSGTPLSTARSARSTCCTPRQRRSEIYLCNVCPCPETLSRHGRGQVWWRLDDPYVGVLEWKTRISKRTSTMRFQAVLRQRLIKDKDNVGAKMRYAVRARGAAACSVAAAATEICLCGVCSCQERLRRRPARPA